MSRRSSYGFHVQKQCSLPGGCTTSFVPDCLKGNSYYVRYRTKNISRTSSHLLLAASARPPFWVLRRFLSTAAGIPGTWIRAFWKASWRGARKEANCQRRWCPRISMGNAVIWGGYWRFAMVMGCRWFVIRRRRWGLFI
jgi:hypothetical protein